MKKIFLIFMALLLIIPSLVLGATVTLQWNSVEEADGYKIYWKTDISGPPYIGTATDEQENPITSPYDVGNNVIGLIIIPPGDYYFAVTAYNDYGESGYSEELGPITVAENTPDPIVLELNTSIITFPDAEEFIGTTYYGTTDKTISLSWTAPINGADEYEVCIYDVFKKICEINTTVLFPSYDFQLPRTGCYTVRINAKKDGEESGWVIVPYRIVGWPGSIDGGGIVIN